MTDQAYPLSWPDGWPRTSLYGKLSDHRFGGQSRITFSAARTSLLDELRLLGAKDVILSTNHRVGRDGVAIETSNVKDHAVAVYFKLKDKPMVMAQDTYTSAAGNMRSLALAIEGLRQMRRHGGAHMMERAFAGFAALPNPDKVDWRAMLGFKNNEPVSVDAVQKRYRALAGSYHPDRGGSEAAMTQLNMARDQALEELQQ